MPAASPHPFAQPFDPSSIARLAWEPVHHHPLQASPGPVEAVVAELSAALPRLAAGLLFLAVAVVAVKVALWVLRRSLERTTGDESAVYRLFVGRAVAVFLWFGVALSFLSIVGFGGIAAALGTASGFVALGVSFALSGMIADVVAGVYLLRDQDFMPGDVVTVGDMTGEVTAIELRKTRFAVEGDVVVRANAEIEKRWRTERGGAGRERSDTGGDAPERSDTGEVATDGSGGTIAGR